MKLTLRPLIAYGLLLAAGSRGAETFDEAMKRATTDYGERLRNAAVELNRTRERIADEKAPLLKEMGAAEDRIVNAETEIHRLQTGEENASERRRKLLSDL